MMKRIIQKRSKENAEIPIEQKSKKMHSFYL
jgi:hypothetical protein